MDQATPQTIHLSDYTPPAFSVDTVELRFELGEEDTLVRAHLALTREAPGPLVLDAEDLDLVSIKLDGRGLADSEFVLAENRLTIANVPEGSFGLETDVRCRPQDNTQLSGLYKSSGNFCTQCEAEGFRRITPYFDRPDMLSRFTVTIVGERARYPVLLSNGNLTDSGDLEDGKHFAVWEDPFPKPAYLFALVAGDLARVEDSFTTLSGRQVALHIYTAPEDSDKCGHAMESLKKAMAWDEEVFGLEYDLDIYNIVAVSDFNMGAMENKSLNVFNTVYVLATPETATDANFAGIEGVIAHEYFHNWTGNRVTCRDWFQLSLKEGLTVFRDQQFSADMGSAAVQRIEDVRMLRARQFPEDAGPLAHPVRPESYIEINNFYTATIYEKGAELIRMMHTLLGPEKFRKGMDLYFQRHDGQAVTCDDFAAAMEDASGVDLSQFKLWYSQAGTPHLTASGAYDPAAETFTLTLEQGTAPTPGQAEKKPLHLPIAIGLLDAAGNDLSLEMDGDDETPTTRVLSLTEDKQSFVFENLSQKPVPSVLRGFSAPAVLDAGLNREERAFLMARDGDAFNGWEASQQLSTDILLSLIDDHRASRDLQLDGIYSDAFSALLKESAADKQFVALAATLPSQAYLAQQMDEIDFEGIEAAHNFVRGHLSTALRGDFERLYRENGSNEPYAFTTEQVGRRSLKNLCLSYLMRVPDEASVEACYGQFMAADNMTDSMAALAALSHQDVPERKQALDAFFERWKDNPLVLDKWFSVQATSERDDTLDAVRGLMSHPAFSLKNPNKVRSLIAAFTNGNLARFNDAGGEGYRLLADVVSDLDSTNPQIAARLLGGFDQWRRYDEARQALVAAEIDRILAKPGLSKDVFEIASKTLKAK